MLHIDTNKTQHNIGYSQAPPANPFKCILGLSPSHQRPYVYAVLEFVI